MKRLSALLLAITLLFSVLTAFSSSISVPAKAEFPSTEVLGGYENICLTYTYRPTRGDYGRQEVQDLLPYVAYLDTEGNMQDFFFDSYLFLPCNTYGPSGASIHGGTGNPTKSIDWVDYVEDTFTPGYNVDALDAAFGQAKATLGDSERKAGVFFTILYPAYNCKNFGVLGGKSLNLSKKADREYAIKWMIDEQMKIYNQRGYENLELLGFYWLEEEIYSNYDRDMMLYASEYLHSLGLKFIWIPWYQAPGYMNWKDYGFDLACMQPNDMWPDVSDVRRVKECAALCDAYGMSMQIEASPHCANSERYERYLRYLEGGLNSGAMNSVKFYYQEGKTAVYYSACYSDKAQYRSVYDLTYKYAKGTLTYEDLPSFAPEVPFEIPASVEWVSCGKSYTGVEAYVGGIGGPYQSVDGTELTDGIMGSSKNGTEWHAYHVSDLDENGRFETTIDLGEVYTDLTDIKAQFLDNYALKVAPPTDVKLYASEDGVNFQLLNTMSLKKDGDMQYISFNTTKRFTARYVKMSFANGAEDLVFCSEFMVGRDLSLPPKTDVFGESSNSSDAESSSQATSDESLSEADGDNNSLIWVVIGAVGALVIALALAVILKKKKNGNSQI